MAVKELVWLGEKVGAVHGGQQLNSWIPKVLEVSLVEVSLEGLKVFYAHAVFGLCVS